MIPKFYSDSNNILINYGLTVIFDSIDANHAFKYLAWKSKCSSMKLATYQKEWL